ncbi:MAG: hypothetical protein K8R68_04185, partial [Bacteroidales bacterium]|nr:hypothetical protein [Bacteroidales bacterium]
LNIIKAVNVGCGFLYFSGHGNPAIWLTNTPNDTDVGRFTIFHMPFLINRNKLPVCIVGGCHNSQFDVSPLDMFRGFREEGLRYFHSPTKKDPYMGSFWNNEWPLECWSWHLMSKPYGGSIATIGCTGLGWLGVEFGGGGINWLELQFFREYVTGTDIIGQIWKNALTEYLNNFSIDWATSAGGTSSLDAKTVQEWVLLGDPSLKIGGYS